MPSLVTTGRESTRPRRVQARSLLRVLVLGGGVGLAADAAALGIRAGSLRAEIEPDPWHVVVRDAEGTIVLAEAGDRGPGPSGPVGFRTPAGWMHATRVVASRRRGATLELVAATTDPAGRRLRVRLARAGEGVLRLEARVEGDTRDVQALGMGFVAATGERFFGLGARATGVDHRGATVESYVADGPYQGEERDLVSLFVPAPGFRARDDATYFPIPWVLSSRGVGVLVDAPETVYHRLGSDVPDAWSVEVVGAPDGTAAGPAPSALRLRVFAGPTPADALRRFTTAVGRQPAAAAPWVFGPWFQAGGPLADRVRQVRTLRDADAPLSVVQTYTHYLPCGAQQEREEAEREQVRTMHALGLAVTTYFNPMVCERYTRAFEAGVAAGAFTRDATGAPYVYPYTGTEIFRVVQVDFFAPAGRRFYAELLREAIADGHDGWMEDFGEYTPLDARTADGRTGWATHNPYAREYHCAAWNAVRRVKRPVVRFQRSGWTGAARCAQVVWGGDPSTTWDFDGLASALWSGLGMGLSGVSTWGSDIGGFFALGERALTGELLDRWVQLGAVSGVMRTQRNGFSLPSKDRPQVEHPDRIANWRRWASFRTQLFPYLAAADAEYRRSGLPIMRHLALAFPAAADAVATDDAFLFGPDLLVAPVLVPGVTERMVRLPPGAWVDLWRAVAFDAGGDGGLVLGAAAVVEGGRVVAVPAPGDEMPIFARAGTLLPLLPAEVDTLADYGDGEPDLVRLADRDDALEILALPRGASEARFLGRERLRSRERSGAWELAIRGRRGRTYAVQASLATLGAPFTPCAVRWNGTALPREAWAFDAAASVLRLAVRGRRGRLVVTADCAS